MKKTLLSAYFYLLMASLCAQSAFQNTFLTNYLTTATPSTVSMFGELPYDGMAKNWLLEAMPGNMTFYTNHLLPIGAINPIFGQISIQPRETSEQLGIDWIGSQMGENQITITNSNQKRRFANKNVFNGYSSKGNRDRNSDGFRDLAQKKRAMAISRLSYNGLRVKSNFNAYYLWADEVGGDLNFDKESDFLGFNRYGTGKHTQYMGFSTRTKVQLNKDKKQGNKHYLIAHLDGKLFDQTTFYGTRGADATEQLLNAAVNYTNKGVMTEFSMGAMYRHQQMSYTPLWNWNGAIFQIDRYSAFAHYETFYAGFKLKTNARLDLENKELGFYPTAQLEYQIPRNDYYNQNWGTIAIFAGKEKQLTLPMMTYERYLNTRKFVYYPDISADYYQKGKYVGAAFQLNSLHWYLPFNLFHDNRITLSKTKLIWRSTALKDNWLPVISDAPALGYEQVSFQKNTSDAWQHLVEIATDLKIDLLRLSGKYRWLDTPNDAISLQPKHTFVVQARADLPKGITTSLAYYRQSPQLLRVNEALSPVNHRLDWAATFQLSRAFGGWISDHSTLNVGINNLTNFRQKMPVIAANVPFSSFYDGSLIWGNVVGINCFVGWKLYLM